jgi:septal ring factor EnvC (AmiA/AmiB activator)
MKSFLKLVLVGLFMVSVVAVSGCTRHPNEKQINALEETISSAKAAQAELDSKKKDRQSLEAQVKEWENKLAAAKKEKAAVEARLQQQGQ